MNRERMEQILEEKGLLPFWTARDMDDTVYIAEVLKETGIPVVEVALRSPMAMDAIRTLKKDPDLYVGAGTVKTLAEAEEAAAAGVDFIVSPGSECGIIEFCLERKIPIYPGVVTPSEILMGYQRGLRCFKFFPAEAYGGIQTLRALRGPFPDVKFLPTGGVGEKKYKEYLAQENVWAAGGSFILPADKIREKDWKGLKEHIRGLL